MMGVMEAANSSDPIVATMALLRRARLRNREQCAGPMWHPSERWRSGWDGEFESPLLQQPVCLSGERRGRKRKVPHIGGGLRVAGDVRGDVQAANRDAFALSL